MARHPLEGHALRLPTDRVEVAACVPADAEVVVRVGAERRHGDTSNGGCGVNGLVGPRLVVYCTRDICSRDLVAVPVAYASESCQAKVELQPALAKGACDAVKSRF